MSVTGLLLLMATAMWWDGVARAVAAQQLRLIHKYAHLDGSRAKSAGQGMTPGYFQTLRAHDRRRLATVIDFPLNGSLGTSGYASHQFTCRSRCQGASVETRLSLLPAGSGPRELSLSVCLSVWLVCVCLWVPDGVGINAPLASHVSGCTIRRSHWGRRHGRTRCWWTPAAMSRGWIAPPAPPVPGAATSRGSVASSPPPSSLLACALPVRVPL